MLSSVRTWNIACRTAHIGLTSVLFGGHAFGVAAPQLRPWLYGAIASGAALIAIEAWSHGAWWHQGRGVLVLIKLLLLGLVPWLWNYRMALLCAVIVLASVGSHMPRRFRYYSLLYRRVMEQPRPNVPGGC